MGVITQLNRDIAQTLRGALEWFYVAPLRRWISQDIFRYGVCGVVNYIIIDATLYYLIYHYIVGMRYIEIGGMVVSPHIASLIVVFPLTFLSGFWLNRYVAFDATRPKKSAQMFRYGVTVGGSIVLSYAILKVAVEVLGVWATPAKVLSSLITAIYSYTMARYYTFQR